MTAGGRPGTGRDGKAAARLRVRTGGDAVFFHPQDPVDIVHKYDPLDQRRQFIGCAEDVGYDDDPVAGVEMARRRAV